MKQQIEIDVPDGYEAITLNAGDEYGNPLTILIKLQKKEPEFIEVREYLHRGSGNYVLHNSIQKNLNQAPKQTEENPNFIRWVDEDWRKVKI